MGLPVKNNNGTTYFSGNLEEGFEFELHNRTGRSYTEISNPPVERIIRGKNGVWEFLAAGSHMDSIEYLNSGEDGHPHVYAYPSAPTFQTPVEPESITVQQAKAQKSWCSCFSCFKK